MIHVVLVEPEIPPNTGKIIRLCANTGAILHLDGTAINSNSPASHGEFVQAYLTGLGDVTPPGADGEAAPSNPPANTNATPTVYIGGRRAAVSFSGLAPTFAGLYQINLKIPDDVPSGPNPFAIETGEAFHDQADIFIAP